MRILGAALALMLLSSPASAAFSGSVLKWYCESYPDEAGTSAGVQAGVCFGYTVGVVDVLGIDVPGIDRQKIGGWSACLPEAVTNSQAVEVTKKFLNDHPALLHLEAQSLVAMALSNAFPCSE